jgi:hypothetical protein
MTDTLAEERAGHLIGSCMWTGTGQLFDILAFDPWAIELADIAHGLSHICRFGGHTREFHSVAAHSVLVSRLCDTEDAARGLLHDAAEAYIGDMISPLKRQPGMEVYREVDRRLSAAVAERFSLGTLETPSVELADRIVVYLEMRDLMAGDPMKYGRKVARPDLSVLGISVEPLPPTKARALFLAQAAELGIF